MPVKSLSYCIVSLILSLGLSACHVHLGEPEQTATLGEESYDVQHKLENFVYTETNWPQALHADLYLPRKAGLHPVVVMIHGGGWANRSRSDMDDISEKLAQQGYAVMNINYRFAPRYTFPAQINDLEQAFNWLDNNAARYSLDMERINTWGYSSGAHLAALVGGLGPSPNRPVLRAVVAGGIPSDLRKYSGSPIVMRFMGGDQHEMPQQYAEASPAYHISSNDPPVFLYHGKLDFLVTQDQATDYYDALVAAGIETELYLHRWRGHMSMFLFGGEAENRAIDFLNRQNSPGQVAVARHN